MFKFVPPQYSYILKDLIHIYEPTVCYENYTKKCLKDIDLVYVPKTLMIFKERVIVNKKLFGTITHIAFMQLL